jgi:hypothetical protein
MTTTTNSLTDRYVDATLRRLPDEKRPDIDKELRALIADAIDARIEAGTHPAAAETAVLTELGDPARLAAGYAERPLHLIGPELFLDYTRLLRTLFVTIVPIVAAVVGLVQVVGGGPVGSMIGTTVGAAITTTVHIFFWTTLAFAAIERTQAVRGPLTGPWTPAMLPEPPPSRRARFGELIAETVALVLFASLLLLAPRLSPKSDASGNPINIMSPWLWESGFVYAFIGLVVLSLGISYANHYARWNAPLAVAATLVDLAAPLALIWLVATDRLLNPAFIEAVGWSTEVVRWIHIGLIVASVLTILHTIAEGFARMRRR